MLGLYLDLHLSYFQQRFSKTNLSAWYYVVTCCGWQSSNCSSNREL